MSEVTVDLDDINQLRKEVELGARAREDSMESGTSSRPLTASERFTMADSKSAEPTGVLTSGLNVLLLLGIFIVLCVYVADERNKDGVTVNMGEVHDEDHHPDEHFPNEVVMSTSASLDGFEYMGALYAGEGEWVDKKDTPDPVEGRSDLQVITCGGNGGGNGDGNGGGNGGGGGGGADGKIYLLGGSSADSTVLDLNLEFDPAFETYRTMAPMPTPRFRFGAACRGDVIYVLGGFTNSTAGDAGQSVTTMDAYDTKTNTWTTELAEMPAARGDLAVSIIANKLYAFGGYGYEYSSADTVTEIYDISLDEWTTGASIPSRRGDLISIAVGTDIYVLGGWVDNFPDFDPSPATEKYDTTTGEWSQLADMQIARGDCGVARVGDKLYVIGGETKAFDSITGEDVTGVPLHDVEQYDIANNVWIRMAPIPAPRFRFGAAAFGEMIYTFGGHAQDTQTVNTVQTFYYVDRPNVFLQREIEA